MILRPRKCDRARGCGCSVCRPAPPPFPPRAKRDTVPYTDEQRIALRLACQPPHPRLVRR